MIVADSNVLSARNLSSVSTRLAEEVEKRDPVWIVPPLWRYEFQNILATAIRNGQLAPEDASEAWRKASAQLKANEHEPDPEAVIDLAGRHRISGYDANFIALAREMGVRCVTEDGELIRKFPGLAVSMAGFVKAGRTGEGVREARARHIAAAARLFCPEGRIVQPLRAERQVQGICEVKYDRRHRG